MAPRKIDLEKYVWEGWRVRDFIVELQPLLDLIQRGESWRPVIKTFAEMKRWCMEEQPYYKRYIPDVVHYFCQRYGIHE